MTPHVHLVLQLDEHGVTHVVGVYAVAALAKRVAARKAGRAVYTVPMNQELGKVKA